MSAFYGGNGVGWVDLLRGVGYPVWGFRIEKKSPDFRSPEVGISEKVVRSIPIWNSEFFSVLFNPHITFHLLFITPIVFT